MNKIIIVAIALLAATGCTRPGKTTKVLEQAGYTNIEITGYKIFGCSEDDAFHTGFKATAPNGTHAKGVVCSGWLKGSTIRTD